MAFIPVYTTHIRNCFRTAASSRIIEDSDSSVFVLEEESDPEEEVGAAVETDMVRLASTDTGTVRHLMNTLSLEPMAYIVSIETAISED